MSHFSRESQIKYRHAIFSLSFPIAPEAQTLYFYKMFLPESYIQGTKVPFGQKYKPLKRKEFDFKTKSSSIEILDSESQARKLHTALHIGDSIIIIAILSKITQYQRTRILNYYKTIYGRKLNQDIKEILGGDFGDACLNIISDPKVYLTKYINNLLKEFPYPKEEKLISVLSERTNEEIQVIQQYYEKRFGKTLDKSFAECLDHEGAKFLKILINPLRQEDYLNSLQAHVDAKNLLNLGIGVSYGDSAYPMIYSLLRKRDYKHIRSVFSEYERLSGQKIWNKIENAMLLNTKKRLLLIIEAINNPGLFTAKVLHRSINYDDFAQTLIHIRLSRSKEFYKSVEHNFAEFYGTRISDVIRTEFNGEYRTLLLSMIDF